MSRTYSRRHEPDRPRRQAKLSDGQNPRVNGHSDQPGETLPVPLVDDPLIIRAGWSRDTAAVFDTALTAAALLDDDKRGLLIRCIGSMAAADFGELEVAS